MWLIWNENQFHFRQYTIKVLLTSELIARWKIYIANSILTFVQFVGVNDRTNITIEQRGKAQSFNCLQRFIEARRRRVAVTNFIRVKSYRTFMITGKEGLGEAVCTWVQLTMASEAKKTLYSLEKPKNIACV